MHKNALQHSWIDARVQEFQAHAFNLNFILEGLGVSASSLDFLCYLLSYILYTYFANRSAI